MIECENALHITPEMDAKFIIQFYAWIYEYKEMQRRIHTIDPSSYQKSDYVIDVHDTLQHMLELVKSLPINFPLREDGCEQYWLTNQGYGGMMPSEMMLLSDAIQYYLDQIHEGIPEGVISDDIVYQVLFTHSVRCIHTGLNRRDGVLFWMNRDNSGIRDGGISLRARMHQGHELLVLIQSYLGLHGCAEFNMREETKTHVLRLCELTGLVDASSIDYLTSILNEIIPTLHRFLWCDSVMEYYKTHE